MSFKVADWALVLMALVATGAVVTLCHQQRLLRNGGVVGINARDFGARGDGMADDTGSLQRAIDAAEQDGAMLSLPAGVYRFSHLHIDRGVSIDGEGWHVSQIRAFFGGSIWNSATGSVLKCIATDGVGIRVGAPDLTGVINFSNLAIVGVGSAGVVGLAAGEDERGLVSSYWSNVLFGNFAVGARLGFVEQSVFTGLRFRGCLVGLDIVSAAFNANTILGIECQQCNQVGLRFSAPGGGNLIDGGVFQTNAIDSVVVRGVSNHIQHCWFENDLATGDDIKFLNGSIACTAEGNTNLKRGIRVIGPDSIGCAVTNNEANRDAHPPIRVDSSIAGRNLLSNNTFFSLP